MSRSFAGGVVRDVEIIAERLIPLMDGMSDSWEHSIFIDAHRLRETLLRFEASLIEAACTKEAAE